MLLWLLIFFLSWFSIYNQATCNSVDYKKRIEGIFNIIDRKHRLDDKVRKIQNNAITSSFSSLSQNNKEDDDKELNYLNKNKKDRKCGKSLCEEEPIQCIRQVMALLN